MNASAFSPLLVPGILFLGAIPVLLAVGPLSRRVAGAAAIGLVFALGALVSGLGQSGLIGTAAVALCGVAIVALLLVPSLETEVPGHAVEAAALLLLGTAGAIALATSLDLLHAIVALETLALSAVVLVAVSRGEAAIEAAFKYFFLGALSLSVLLFGVGLVYLGTGSFAFPTAQQAGASPIVMAGLVLVTLGFVFELAVVPFQWGAVDAYTAASPGIAGWVMSASKIAGAFVLGRLVVEAGAPSQQILVWIGTLTIAWGTFAAIAQTTLRRMLAYSAVTHAGFIALAAGSGAQGPSTAVFYATVYGSMAMLTFAALAGRGDDRFPYEDVRAADLGPLRAAALALGLMSLSGIPPTPGFWAKLAVLQAAWMSAGPLPTLVAVAGGVFAVLYYLRPIPDLFAATRAAVPEGLTRPSLPAIVLAGAAVVALGLFPNLAWSLARSLGG